jgi:hypothetical protein
MKTRNLIQIGTIIILLAVVGVLPWPSITVLAVRSSAEWLRTL